MNVFQILIKEIDKQIVFLRKTLKRYLYPQVIFIFYKFISRYRISSIASEIAFFGIISLPAFILSSIWMIGLVSHYTTIPIDFSNFVNKEKGDLSILLNDDLYHNLGVIIKEVLTNQHYKGYSLAAFILVFSGSQIIRIYISGISIIYGTENKYNLFKIRFYTFLIHICYILLVILYQIIISYISLRMLSFKTSSSIITLFMIIFTSLLIILILSSIYVMAEPDRKIREHIPGSIIAFSLFIINSLILSYLLKYFIRSLKLFGLFTIPLSILIWLYLLSFSALIGAIYNQISYELNHIFTKKRLRSLLLLPFKRLNPEEIVFLDFYKKRTRF